MTSMVTARVPEEIKRQAKRVFANSGTTLSNGIYEYLEYVAKNKRTVSKSRPKARSRRLEDLSEQQQVSIRSILNRPKLEIDWGDDLNRSYKDLVAEAVIEKYERCGDGYSL